MTIVKNEDITRPKIMINTDALNLNSTSNTNNLETLSRTERNSHFINSIFLWAMPTIPAKITVKFRNKTIKIRIAHESLAFIKTSN